MPEYHWAKVSQYGVLKDWRCRGWNGQAIGSEVGRAVRRRRAAGRNRAGKSQSKHQDRDLPLSTHCSHLTFFVNLIFLVKNKTVSLVLLKNYNGGWGDNLETKAKDVLLAFSEKVLTPKFAAKEDKNVSHLPVQLAKPWGGRASRLNLFCSRFLCHLNMHVPLNYRVISLVTP